MNDLSKPDVMIENNCDHLPMLIDAENGYFKRNNVGVKMPMVDTNGW